MRKGIHIMAIAIATAVAIASLGSCNRSDRGAEIGQPQAAIGEKPDISEPAGSHARRAMISSNFPCKESSDCTFTKFANVPKAEADCACLAACTPFVTNMSEKTRREAANRKFCGEKRRSMGGCPSPPCGFITFEKFNCIDGRCTGYARIE